MCGRYYIEIDNDELADIVAAIEKAGLTDYQPVKSGEIFPGDSVTVLTASQPVLMTWGYPNSTGNRPHINARSETAATKPTFRDAMANRRCLIPASGYYEWKKAGKNQKEKYVFRLQNNELMYFAAIYSNDGRFAILTRAAVPSITEIHDRMPVIIPKNLTYAWLQDGVDILKESITDLSFMPLPKAGNQPVQMSLFS